LYASINSKTNLCLFVNIYPGFFISHIDGGGFQNIWGWGCLGWEKKGVGAKEREMFEWRGICLGGGVFV
jgi:hypothetical protein